MVDTVCIVGAGWKCGMLEVRAAPSTIPFRCPELLFPLGNGQTVLSRLVKQFRSFGAKNFLVGIGNPDNCPTIPQEDILHKLYGVSCPGYGQSPWTHARVKYVRSLGVGVVLMDNPLHFSGWATYRSIFGKLLKTGGWEKAIGLSGDYVFNTAFLKNVIANNAWPSMCWLEPVHELLFLTHDGLTRFVGFMDSHVNAKRQDYLGGGCVWKDRIRLGKKWGIHGWSPGWFKNYTNKTHRADELVRFQEIGTKVNEWKRACLIEKKDPI